MKEKTLRIRTTRFGDIEVSEEKVIVFGSGLPGFEGLRRFILLDHDEDGLFKWLQSVDEPSVAFLLTNPTFFKPDYAVPMAKIDAQQIAVGDPSDLVTLVMVSVPRGRDHLSLNLKGPLVFNSANMRARQLIIDREDYPCQFVVPIERPAVQAGKE